MNLFTLYNIYITMRNVHGVYITYSFFSWFLGNIYIYSTWLLSFVYDPYLIRQIENKKLKNESEKDVHK